MSLTEPVANASLTAPTTPSGATASGLKRRGLVAGLAAAAVTFTSPRPASAATGGTNIAGLTPQDRSLLRRFSYGVNARLVTQVNDAGGARAWLTAQMTPDAIADVPGNQVDGWYPALSLTPQQMWSKFKADRSVTPTTTSEDFVRWTLMKRMTSNRQLLEVMTEFWSNVLHVPSPNEKSWVWRIDYDKVIRRNALGRFDDMLQAAALHPAMLLYLDAYDSTKTAPNENLGRELLELHTVGRTAGYGEDGVANSTRILTGWSVDKAGTWNAQYNAADHYVGPVQVMDFTDPNGSADGRATTYAYLKYLAHHPATAQRIAARLVTRFVSDTPSDTLVNDVANAYLSAGTDIKATLRALVNHPEFVSSAAPKVRTPTEDYIASCRALRLYVKAPATDNDFARYIIWQAMNIGPRPFDWPTPDGFPDVSDAWASATRMLGSWSVHHGLAFQNLQGNVTYQPNSFWLPALPLPFDQFATKVATKLLFEVPSPVVIAGAAAAVGVTTTELITSTHKLVTERFPLLLCALLDSPLHMNR